MNTRISSKSEFFVKILNRVFCKKKLIIFIGNEGTTLSVLRWNKVKKSIFITKDDESYEDKCYQFLEKYKKYYISFLLDNEDCLLKNENLPTISSFVHINSIDKTIKNYYDASDIVGYNLYNTTNKKDKNWHSSIASSPLTKHIDNLLKYIINNSFNYAGSYFLPLEFKHIINNLLTKEHKAKCSSDLQIFSIITKSSGIKIIVKHENHLIEEKSIEYPTNKSPLHALILIEQAIKDKIVFYKEYTKKQGIQTCIILFLNRELYELSLNLKFENHTTINITSNKDNIRDNHFQDHTLIEKFNKTRRYLSFNEELKALTNNTLIDNIILKPLKIILFGSIIALGFIKYKSILAISKIEDLNQQRYILEDAQRKFPIHHSDITNINDIVNLYNLEQTIQTHNTKPFKYLSNLLTPNKNNLKLTQINWKINKQENSPKELLNITIDITYKGDSKSSSNGIQILNKYAEDLQSNFQDYDVIYTRNPEHLLYIVKNVIIPARIIIQNKGENND